MRLRTPLHGWTTAFFATLGLTPLTACESTILNADDHEVEAGVGGQGGAKGETGGNRNTGGRPGGGAGGWTSVPTGGVPGGTGGEGPTGGAVGTGGRASPFIDACSSAVPRYGLDGKPSGYVNCDGGTIARREVKACASFLPRARECKHVSQCDGTDAGCEPLPSTCQKDADCNAFPNGHCEDPSSLTPLGCACQYGCVTDSECPRGNVCLCGEPVGRCVPATCTEKADCTAGAECLSYEKPFGELGFTCQIPADQCAVNDECNPGYECLLVDGARRCDIAFHNVDGRPFLVGGAARVAKAVSRADWVSALRPDIGHLSADERAILAEHWTATALMEHASIAAFARFGLELLSLGAPPSLVAQSTAAMADEDGHARDAFALASAYGGVPVGPGELDIAAALERRTPFDIVRDAILEGCIGETVAAVEAAEALAHATDGAVRAALERVVVEETRHAELAFRFVQWVLESGAPELRAFAASELVGAATREIAAEHGARRRITPSPSRGVQEHGFLGERARREIRRRVLQFVVLPCACALVAKTAPPLATVA